MAKINYLIYWKNIIYIFKYNIYLQHEKYLL